MPNKKRRNKNAPSLDFELPPTTLAKTTNLSTTKSRLRAKRNRRATNTFESQDDTPKAFTRLLAFAAGTRRLPKGPDNGRPPPSSSSSSSSKKRKTADADPKEAKEQKMKDAAEQLTIQPGESLREFNRRVDASLPVDLKVAREPRKPKAKKAEAAKAAPAQELEEEGDYSDGEGGGRRKRRRAASPDPWAVLASKREAPKFGDVAPAPPSLARPREVLHSRGIVDVEGVPKSAGSRARREGLAVERKGVVEAYRRLMQGRRGEEV
ncbi:uncharacterized protein H6S33_008631 [Morchella sextelata]|uniref:uncharacterized protein n=1 Tax=Morchella sextelata TaxID=1174677 RepID=UPI001D041F04|nr:uncharacterized protein H6S33_008631 [Morchella sextelata]KAH0602550.1 hypothetical protein H6S33_008631 [Morchella sextelata]